jgi:hypothetical protein
MTNLKDVFKQVYELGKNNSDFDSYWYHWQNTDEMIDCLKKHIEYHQFNAVRQLVKQNQTLQNEACFMEMYCDEIRFYDKHKHQLMTEEWYSDEFWDKLSDEISTLNLDKKSYTIIL